MIFKLKRNHYLIDYYKEHFWHGQDYTSCHAEWVEVLAMTPSAVVRGPDGEFEFLQAWTIRFPDGWIDIVSSIDLERDMRDLLYVSWDFPDEQMKALVEAQRECDADPELNTPRDVARRQADLDERKGIPNLADRRLPKSLVHGETVSPL